jgi:uncharacterized protein (UPF0262 family)
VTLREVRVDEELWSAAGEVRRLEWRTLITDLLDEGALVLPRGASRLVLALRARAIELAFFDGTSEVGRTSVNDTAIIAVLDEYLAVVRRMTTDDLHPSQLEALDMAKRVIHDRGARVLSDLVPIDGANEPKRRLFSLVVAVWVDTTALPLTHRHAK